jgi:hypothetical protein
MANDRIYMTCKHCDARGLLYKHYPGGGYVWPDAEAFIRRHLDECHPSGWALDLDGDPGFTLHAESAEAVERVR